MSNEERRIFYNTVLILIIFWELNFIHYKNQESWLVFQRIRKKNRIHTRRTVSWSTINWKHIYRHHFRGLLQFFLHMIINKTFFFKYFLFTTQKLGPNNRHNFYVIKRSFKISLNKSAEFITKWKYFVFNYISEEIMKNNIPNIMWRKDSFSICEKNLVFEKFVSSIYMPINVFLIFNCPLFTKILAII